MLAKTPAQTSRTSHQQRTEKPYGALHIPPLSATDADDAAAGAAVVVLTAGAGGAAGAGVVCVIYSLTFFSRIGSSLLRYLGE